MKMRYIMRGFTSVVRLPLFLIVVFTISAAAQEQPENNQFNGLDYTLQKPAKNERYAKKKFGDHLFISGEAGLILDRSAGSLFATPGLGLRAGLTVGDWFSPVHGMRVGLNAGLHNGLAGVNPYFVGLSADYLMNITSLLHKDNPVRMFELIGVAGGEYQLLYRTGNWSHAGGFRLGMQTRFNFSPLTFFYLIELNRDQNHSKLCRYDAESGKLQQVLIEERHPKYVEPQSPILFLPWDSHKFIYQSQRDGFNHLYLYNTEGELLKQLTSGPWLVQDIVGFNRNTKELIIKSTEISPLQSNLYAVNLKNGKRSLIGDPTGVHSAQISGFMGTYLIDNASSPTCPRIIKLMSTNPKKQREHTLLTAKNPYEGFEMPSIEVGTIKAADGKTDLYYRLIKPADFDPAKKYPAIVYVYGGPHAQMITNGWMNDARGWDIYMANKGYILFSLDNRGSSNRGLEFENATFRQLGIEEGKDQVKGVEFLKSQPYVDGERIGVHGWSFGGHMTTALMLRYPEIFKVGVAGGPVIDWAYYEIMYGERYMDTPQTNPEGYKQTNLKNLAGNLKGHLLIIHDDHDDTCVPQHTLSFMKACVDARTYPDLFIYPTHKHNVLGRDRVHLHEKITRYFEEYL